MYTPTKTHDFFFVLGLWGVGQKTAFDYLWQRRKTRMQLSLQKVTHKPGVHSFNHLSFANYCYYCWLLPLLLASLCTFCQTWILKCTHSRTEGCLVKLKIYIYINYIKLKLKCVCVCVCIFWETIEGGRRRTMGGGGGNVVEPSSLVYIPHPQRP